MQDQLFFYGMCMLMYISVEDVDSLGFKPLGAKYLVYIISSGLVLLRLNKDTKVKLSQMSCSELHKSHKIWTFKFRFF